MRGAYGKECDGKKGLLKRDQIQISFDVMQKLNLERRIPNPGCMVPGIIFERQFPSPSSIIKDKEARVVQALDTNCPRT